VSAPCSPTQGGARASIAACVHAASRLRSGLGSHADARGGARPTHVTGADPRGPGLVPLADRTVASRGARPAPARRAGSRGGEHEVVARPGEPLRVLGVDFTSSPRAAKPITVALAWLQAPREGEAPARLVFESLEAMVDFDGFEALLGAPGPWVGGFDFPFGLPREAVEALDWPREWTALVLHCAAIGRAAFRTALDAHRETRPWGARYEHRAGDRAAGSHSPLKLVNPPVGLMFLEGAPRLARAGLHLPGLVEGDRSRVALEAYPGHWVRARERASYKSDTPAKQTAERRAARERIVRAMTQGDPDADLAVDLPPTLARVAIEDASGDALDAMVCALQAAAAALQAERGWGLPEGVDPLEGWIAGVRPLRAQRT
jgi:hypothetical protein